MSSSRNGTRADQELGICYSCGTEWLREGDSLECPECHSDFVEIVENHDSHPTPREQSHSPTSPSHPLHAHNPWRGMASDPEEEDIDHLSLNLGPGFHIQRTFVRSGSGRTGANRSPNDDTVDSLFQAIGGIFYNPNNPTNPTNTGRRPPQPTGGMFANSPQFATRNPFNPNINHPQAGLPRARVRASWSTNFGSGGHDTWTTDDHDFQPNNDRDNPMGQTAGMSPLQGMVAAIAQQVRMHAADPTAQTRGNTALPMGLADIFAQALNPNGVHGDGVYTQESFDRLMSQFMEQANSSSAPGPASEAAIAALPKKKIDKSMLGSDGKAECSVCMDNVDVGDEVTVLPCNHWFHQQCVAIWLKEHDTCPHCRKGIMPAEGTTQQQGGAATSPLRAPGQLPRHNTNPFDRHPAAPFTQPGMQHPYVPGGYPSYPEPQNYVQPPLPSSSSTHSMEYLDPQSATAALNQSQSHLHRHSSRRQRSRASSTSSRNHSNGQEGGGGGGSLASNWFRRLRGGSRNSES